MTTKTQFIDAMATKNHISKSEAEKATNMFLNTLKEELAYSSDGVCFRDLFTIKVVTRKGRSGNINGRGFNSSDSKTLRIITGKKLKEELNF